MQFGKSLSGLLLLIMAAIFGLILLYVPGWLIDKYHTVRELGTFWGTAYLILVGLGSALFVGSAAWIGWRLWGASLRKRASRERRSKNPSELSLGQQQTEFDENIESLRELRGKSVDNPKLQAELDPLLADVIEKRESLTLEIVAFGTISSGKSSVLNLLAGRDIFATDARGGTTVTRNEVPWENVDKVILVDTPGLGEVDGEQHVWIAADSAKDADLVILVVDGPLRESEYKLLERLGQMEKRVLICLNKSDWYLPEDREKLLGQLRSQAKSWVDPSEVVSIQSQPGTRLRRRVTARGETIDESIMIPQDIGPLADRMLQIVKRDRKELVLANLLLRSRGLLEKARQNIKKDLDDKAWSLVDRYMWGAAGVAAANPFPMVDLIAGIGISTKMIVDLAGLYGQKADLQTASKWLSEMGKILISVLGSQGVSLAAASIAASLFKIVPGILVGNALQGAIQALITRWIGAVFIDYFGNEMNFAEGGLANSARRQWEKITTMDELRKLVAQAREKFSGK